MHGSHLGPSSAAPPDIARGSPTSFAFGGLVTVGNENLDCTSETFWRCNEQARRDKRGGWRGYNSKNAITGDHSQQDQILLVKMVKYILVGFYVYHRSY